MPIKVQIIGADALEKIGQLAKGAKETLVRDIFGASQRFGFDAVAIAKRDYLRGPRPDKVMSTGQLKASLSTETTREGNVIKTTVGSPLVYAPIQEMGGTTHPNVTDRMRKFAWAMFFKTSDEKWKRMALTKKNRLTIKIPARPYLRPGLEDAMPTFKENLARILANVNFQGAV